MSIVLFQPDLTESTEKTGLNLDLLPKNPIVKYYIGYILKKVTRKIAHDLCFY